MSDAGRSGTTRYAFILGTGRCGSSLLQEVLARHPDVGFVSNVEDRVRATRPLARWNNRLYRFVSPERTRKGRLRFAPSEGYNALNAEVSPLLSRPFRDLVAADATPWLARRLRRFFERRAEQQGQAVFLHKFTGWPRSGLLDAVLPAPRYIHVVRDGRAVVNSYLQMSWWTGFGGPERWQWGPLSDADRAEWEASGRSFAVLAAINWRLLMAAHERARALVDPARWHQLRYEDLLQDPVGRLREVLDHLGLRWLPAFERAVERHRIHGGRRQAYSADLSPADLALVEKALAPVLEANGYRVG